MVINGFEQKISVSIEKKHFFFLKQ